MVSLLRRAFAPARQTVVSTRSNVWPIEPLESRTLLSTATPSPEEQFMLELINRSRALPAVEAKRYGINLNEGLAANTLSTSACQPLAFNLNLISAARQHSQWMLAAKAFSHTGANGTNPQTRMINAGYVFPAGSTSWAENLGWSGRKLSTPVTADMVAELHRRLFVDAGVSGRGHRVNLLRDNLKEVGVGVATGTFNGFHAAMATADFASRGSRSSLTGVAYTDAIKPNKFYNVGEGLAGITITATRSDGKVFSITTWSSGGYTLPLSAGTYTVRASGNLFPPTSSTITLKDRNVKMDFLPIAIVDKSAPSATLLATRRVSSARPRTIRVDFHDDTLVDASTITPGDILILGPNNFSRSPKLISLTPSADSGIITATYTLTTRKPGHYTVKLMPHSIKDTVGHFNKPRVLGSFTIKPT
jgi:uncharacterized protein YkwD